MQARTLLSPLPQPDPESNPEVDARSATIAGTSAAPDYALLTQRSFGLSSQESLPGGDADLDNFDLFMESNNQDQLAWAQQYNLESFEGSFGTSDLFGLNGATSSGTAIPAVLGDEATIAPADIFCPYQTLSHHSLSTFPCLSTGEAEPSAARNVYELTPYHGMGSNPIISHPPGSDTDSALTPKSRPQALRDQLQDSTSTLISSTEPEPQATATNQTRGVLNSQRSTVDLTSATSGLPPTLNSASQTAISDYVFTFHSKETDGPQRSNKGRKRARGRDSSMVGDQRCASPSLPKRKRTKNGAICVRCKIFKEKCSGSFPCQSCQSLNLWGPICVKARFSDTFILGKDVFASRLSSSLAKVDYWSQSPPVSVQVSTGFNATFTVQLQQFVPNDPSVLEHILWRVEGNDRPLERVPSPPWALHNDGITGDQINTFLDELVPELLNEASFKKKDTLWRTTFDFALEKSKESSEVAGLVKDCLRLWAAQSIWFNHILRVKSGAETIGCTWESNAKIFIIPRVLCIQLEFTMDHFIKVLERSILARLEQYVFNRRPATASALFLAAFVFLATVENDTWMMRNWKAKVERWATLPPEKGTIFPQWPRQEPIDYFLAHNDHYARVIYAHVRACCKGSFPFTATVCDGLRVNLGKAKDPDVLRYLTLVQHDLQQIDSNVTTRRAKMVFIEQAKDSLQYLYVSSLFVE